MFQCDYDRQISQLDEHTLGHHQREAKHREKPHQPWGAFPESNCGEFRRYQQRSAVVNDAFG